MSATMTVSEMTVTYEVKVQPEGDEGWRAQFRDVVAVATDPALAVAAVLETLAVRMRNTQGSDDSGRGPRRW